MSQLGIEMEPQQRSKRSRFGAALAVVLALLVVAALLAGLLVVAFKLIKTGGTDDYAGPGSGQVDVRVVSGQTSQQIGTTLAVNGVIRSASVFANLGDDRLRQIQPGTYRMRKRMSAAGALDLLLDPTARVSLRVVIPEGAPVKKTLALLAAKGHLDPGDLAAAAADTSSLGLPPYANGKLEGFLFPATYDVDPSTTAQDQLQAMVKRWRQAAATDDLVAGAKKLKLDPYQVMIVASLLQAEVRNPDFPKVARVIYNRLDAGMPLQLDTTVLYALGRSDTNLTPDDLKTNSPFNTYLHKGLPPTPISNPGEAAIRAALNPVKGNWLYYVTVDLKTGKTKFTNSYKEFLQFKKELKANSGS